MSGFEIPILIASTAFSAVTTYQSQKAQGAFQEAAAEVDRVANEDAANTAKLQGAQQEVERLREFEELQQFNRNMLKVDTYGQGSIATFQKRQRGALKSDLSNLRLQTLETERKFLLGAHSASIDAQSGRYLSKTAGTAAMGKLMQGAASTAALTYVPKTPGLTADASMPGFRPGQ